MLDIWQNNSNRNFRANKTGLSEDSLLQDMKLLGKLYDSNYIEGEQDKLYEFQALLDEHFGNDKGEFDVLNNLKEVTQKLLLQ